MACSHLEDFKTNVGLESYEIIHNTIISPKKKSSSCPEAMVSCFDCENFNNTCRLLACLHCVYFGCYETHIRNHFTSKNHHLCVELSNGHVICFLCQDVVYDSDVDDVMRKCLNESTEPHYVSWKPSSYECQLLKEHPRRIKLDSNSSIGMRGFLNMGNSCFMNCIMQALLHTPLLRDYFFADKHICHSTDQRDCLYCDFFSVFQRYYSDDDPTALSLHEILYFFWQNDVNFSCPKSQKDAHEYFISVRNFLHQFLSSPNSSHKGTCSGCIVDTIFLGTMQSDLVCLQCSNVSTTLDPLWEISLDIPESADCASLSKCLNQFTMPELGENREMTFNCSKCNTDQECTKQCTFKLLPLVIVIHLKRFEQIITGTICRNKKKTMYVSFPIELDMTPFVTGQRNKTTDNSKRNFSEELIFCDFRYSLYAVIVHIGTLEEGHYFAYIRRTPNRWFKCNDISVEPADEEDVLNSEGYLLFYHKTVLSYE